MAKGGAAGVGRTPPPPPNKQGADTSNAGGAAGPQKQTREDIGDKNTGGFGTAFRKKMPGEAGGVAAGFVGALGGGLAGLAAEKIVQLFQPKPPPPPPAPQMHDIQ